MMCLVDDDNVERIMSRRFEDTLRVLRSTSQM